MKFDRLFLKFTKTVLKKSYIFRGKALTALLLTFGTQTRMIDLINSLQFLFQLFH